MKDQLNQFVANTNGQFIEVSSKSALYQCMDLVYLWVFILGYPKATIQNQYAYQVWTNPKTITKQYFDLLPNTPSFIPEDGDIVVFNKTSSNIAGHIAVCLGGGTTSSFMLYEQNAPIGTSAHLSKNWYRNVLGFLRPKVRPVLEINDQTILPIVDSKGKEMEVQAVRSKLADQEQRITNLLTSTDNLLKDIDILKKDINTLKLEKAALNTFINGLNEKITELEQEIFYLKGLPNQFMETLQAIHDVLYGSGWWWVKYNKIKTLVPKQT